VSTRLLYLIFIRLLGWNGQLSPRRHQLGAIVVLSVAVLIWRAVRIPGIARLSGIILAIAIPVFANTPSFFFHYRAAQPPPTDETDG
jgi:hypothetical protein